MSTSPDVRAQDVEDSRSAAMWSVQEQGWDHVLPEDVADLLAPPVVVSAEAVAPAAVPGPRQSDRAPRMLVPAPPRPRRIRGRRRPATVAG